MDGVRRATYYVARVVIGDDPVDVFTRALGGRVVDDMFGLRRETGQQGRMARAARKPGENVGIFVGGSIERGLHLERGLDFDPRHTVAREGEADQERG